MVKTKVQCECGLMIHSYCLEAHRKGRYHRSKMEADYIDEYKERKKDRSRKLVSCECGSVVMKHYLNKHKKTAKHLNYLKCQTC